MKAYIIALTALLFATACVRNNYAGATNADKAACRIEAHVARSDGGSSSKANRVYNECMEDLGYEAE